MYCLLPGPELLITWNQKCLTNILSDVLDSSPTQSFYVSEIIVSEMQCPLLSGHKFLRVSIGATLLAEYIMTS